MKDQQINTFSKGMLSDLGATLPQEGSYTYAENIRIISEGSSGGESGVVVNVKGNSKKFTLTRKVTPTIDADVTPIGYANIRNILIVFGVSGCLSIEADCIGSTSTIHTIDLDTNEITLIYQNPDLRFSADNPIEAVGRYESELTQRVYWVDGVNEVRVINVANPISSSTPVSQFNILPAISLSNLDILSINSAGDLLSGMYQYAYRLRTKEGLETRFTPLTNPVHVTSKGSNYWLYEEDPEATQTEINGDPPGTPTNKAVMLKVENISSEYDEIEFAVVYRDTVAGVQDGNVYIFDSKPVFQGTARGVHKSNTPLYTISLQELLSFSFAVSSAETITSKENILFLGNLKEERVDLQFNSRAYRWKRGDNIHYPYKPTDNVSTYVNTPFAEEPSTEDLDAINPFNNLDGNDRNSEYKYKYQQDGVTLGGEGPNISYKFIKKKLSGDTLCGTESAVPPFVSSNLAEKDCFGSVNIDSLIDYKSGEATAMFKGYQRDEVYRFGIVLNDLKGNPGYVNWIGDIRFPSVDDVDVSSIVTSLDLEGVDGLEGALELLANTIIYPGVNHNFSLAQTERSDSGASYFIEPDDSTHQDLTQEGAITISNVSNARGQHSSTGVDSEYVNPDEKNDGTHYLYALGIEFTVNIPDNIKDKVSGYQIVRVKREDYDKTVLGVGLVNYVHAFVTGNSRFALNRNLYYTDYQSANTHFGYHHDYHRLQFDCPDFIFNQDYPSKNDCTYFQYYGALSNGREFNAYRDDFEGTDHINYRKYLSHIVDNAKPAEPYEGDQDILPMFPLLDMFKLGRGETRKWSWKYAYPSGDGWEYQSDDDEYIMNWAIEDVLTGSSAGNFYTVSVGEETLFLNLPRKEGELTNTTSPLGNSISSLHWKNYIPHYDDPQQVNFDPASSSGTNNQNVLKYEKLLGAIRKDLSSGTEESIQYFGATALERVSNEYISTGNYVQLGESSENTTVVFGGDTYVAMYDLEKTRMRDSGIDGYSGNDGGSYGTSSDSDYIPTRGYSYVFPVETSINLALRTGFHMANKENFNLTSNDTLLSEFLYESVYSVENDLQSYFPKNELKPEPEIFDYRIAYSQAKDDNELVDSWRNFKPLSFKDLEGTQGALHDISVVGEGLVFLQETGVGIIQVKPLSSTLDQSGTSIVLGKGETIAAVKYLSRSAGLQNKTSSIATGETIYWVDEAEKSIYTIGEKGATNLSDALFVKSLLRDSLDSGHKITVGYDKINSEVLFSLGNNKTLVFNENTKSFTSMYTMDTPLYMQTSKGLFSTKDNFIYEHNEGGYSWFDTPYDSSIEFTVNKNPIYTKVFDNIEWYTGSNDNKFQSGTFSNSIDVKVDDLSEAVVKERMTKMPIPRMNSHYRFRDTYMKVKLVSSNAGKFILHYVKTWFRISHR
jgi:hypothetical protein